MIFTNFFTSFWYTPRSERGSLRPASFLLSPLPYKYIHYFSSASQIQSQSLPLHIDIEELALSLSIKDVLNIEGLPAQPVYRDVLPSEVFNDLLQAIKDLFFLDEKDKQQIDFLASYMVEDKFKDGSWDCTECQRRGMDKQRNCTLLSQEDQKRYYDSRFFVTIGGDKWNRCPIPSLDRTKLEAVVEAVNLFSKGFLPEAGGMGDQTLFFGYTSQIVSNFIDQHNNKKMEEMSSIQQ